jgi:hypothetical protein
MWCWRRIGWVSWTDPMKDEEIWYIEIRKKIISYIQQKEGILTGMLTSCVGTVS